MKQLASSHVIWLRHGQSEYNVYRTALIQQGRWKDELRGRNTFVDCAMTELGRKQCLTQYQQHAPLFE